MKDNTGQVHDQIGGEENKKSNEHEHHRHHRSDTPGDNVSSILFLLVDLMTYLSWHLTISSVIILIVSFKPFSG